MHHQYLAALKYQVATTLRPADMGEMATKYSLYCERVLAYLAVNSRELPALSTKLIAACRELLPELKAALPNEPAIVAALEADLHITVNPARALATLQGAVLLLVRQSDPAARSLLHRIGALELQLQQAFAAAMEQENAPVVTTADANEGLAPEQKQRLTALLRARFPQDSALEIGRVKAIPGGFSKQTIFLDLLNTSSLPVSVVLRIDKADSPVETTVADEFEIIQAVHAAGVPAPKPLLLETDKAVLGGAFVVVSRVEGNAAGDAFEVLDRRPIFGETLARGLAKLHAVPTDAVSDRVPGARISVRERMLGDIDTFEAKWRATGHASLTLELAYGWLRANIEQADSGQRSLIHRDVGCHNLLVKDAQLTAILDWETALIGDPAQDIGYVWHTVTQVMSWEEFLAAYESAGGRRPSVQGINFYRVWRHVWLMTMQCQARTAIEAGYTLDMGLLYNVLNLYQRLSLSLQALLCEIDN